MMYADTLIGKEYIEGENTQEYVDMYLDYINDMLMEFGMTAFCIRRVRIFCGVIEHDKGRVVL